MPSKEDKKDLTFSDKRKDRQDKRVDRLTEKRDTEAKRAGVNLSDDIGPSTKERKARIDKTLNDGVSKDLETGLKKIQDLRTPPKTETQLKPGSDLTIKDVRKQRQSTIADILNTVYQVKRGQNITPTKFRDNQYNQRLNQYDQFKKTSAASKKKVNEWEDAYITEQLDYLKEIRDNPGTSKLKRDQINKQIEKLDAEIKYKNKQTKLLGTKKNKDTDENMVTRTRTIDDDTRLQEKITIPQARKAEYEAEIEAAVSPKRIQLQQAESELAKMAATNEGTGFWEVKDKPIKKRLEADIETLKQQIKEDTDRISTKYGPRETSGKSNSNKSNAPQSDFEKITSKYLNSDPANYNEKAYSNISNK